MGDVSCIPMEVRVRVYTFVKFIFHEFLILNSVRGIVVTYTDVVVEVCK